MRRLVDIAICAGLSALLVAVSQGAIAADCPADHDKLEKALKASVKPSGGPTNGGLDNNEWAALVTRDGAVCAVAFSGGKPDDPCSAFAFWSLHTGGAHFALAGRSARRPSPTPS